MDGGRFLRAAERFGSWVGIASGRGRQVRVRWATFAITALASNLQQLRFRRESGREERQSEPG